MPLPVDTDAIYRAVLTVVGRQFLDVTLPAEFRPKESSVFRSTGHVWKVKLTAERKLSGSSIVCWYTTSDAAIQDLIDAHGADLAGHLVWGLVRRELQALDWPPIPTTPPISAFR